MFNQGGWFDGNYILAANLPGFGIFSSWNISSTQGVTIAAYDMATGHLGFSSTLAPPASLPNDFGNSFETIYEFNGVFYCFEKQTMQWVAWDVEKGGQPIWVSEPYTNPWGMYASSGGEMNAFGIFYAAGWDGQIHAYSDTNGKKLGFFIS